MRTTFEINLNDKNTYTEEDRLLVEQLIVKDAYPELYNNNYLDTIKFNGFKLTEEENITTDLGGGVTKYDVYGRSQQARLSGGTTDEEDELLDKSCVNSGIKLFLPPPAYYTVDGVKQAIITGHRRDKIHRKRNFTNRLFAEYIRKPGFTDDQVRDELSRKGNEWNPSNDPCVPAKQYDIEAEGVRAVYEGWCEWEITAIQNRLRPQAKAVGIGETVLSLMAVNVYNLTNPNNKGKGKKSVPLIIPMGEDRAVEWLVNSKYKNIPNKIEYRPLSYSTWGKNFSTLMITAKKNPDTEFRVIVHAGVVKNLEEYDRRVAKFYNKMHEVLDAVSFVCKIGRPLKFGNIVLYGAIPQVSSNHSLTELNLFHKDGDGTYYQKT